MRILLTDADTRAALAATRSLARAGHTVITAGERRKCLAGTSRFSSAFLPYPSPTVSPSEFLQSITTAAKAWSVDVLLPMTEITTLLLTQHRDDLPPGCRLPFAPAAAISRASDKAAVLEMARDLDIPVPRTSLIRSIEEAPRVNYTDAYPVVVKPARSRSRAGDRWISSKVSYAWSQDELASTLAGLDPEAYPVLLQERVTGQGVGIFACYCDGRPVALFSHRRLREKPPSGGVSVLSESTPLDPVAVAYATRLLDGLAWHGVAMVEFKKDDRDGTFRLMEINSRFWGSLQLAINSGVDFPRIAVDVATDNLNSPVFTYRTGVRNRWFLGDLDALVAVLLRDRESLNLPPGFPSRTKLLGEFFNCLNPNVHYEVWSLSDPRPGLLELARWLTRS